MPVQVVLSLNSLPTPTLNHRNITCIIQRSRKGLQPLRDFLLINIHHAHTFQASP